MMKKALEKLVEENKLALDQLNQLAIASKDATIDEKDIALGLLNDEVAELEQSNLELQAEIQRLEQRAIPFLTDSKKDNAMLLIEKHNADVYPYICVYGQQGYVAQKIQHKLLDYPNGAMVVLVETPNAIVHYNFLREHVCIIDNPERVRHFRLGEN